MLTLLFCGVFCLTHHILASSFFHIGSVSFFFSLSFFFFFFFFFFFSFLFRGVSLTHPVLAAFLTGEFLLQCWLYFAVGSFSYTSRAGFIFIWGVSLTHPVLALLCCGEFLLHIPCWLHFIWGVSLTHSMLALLFCGRFLLHIPC